MADGPAPIMVGDTPDPMVIMRRVVDQALVLVPAAQGAVVELVSHDVLTYVCAAGDLAQQLGTKVPLRGSLSGLAIQCRSTLRCDDAATDDRVDHATCARLGISSMICVPLGRGAEAIGVLTVSAPQVSAFSDADQRRLAGLAGFISEAVGAWSDVTRSAIAALSGARAAPIGMSEEADPPGAGPCDERIATFLKNVLSQGAARDHEARQRIQEVLAKAAVAIMFQPIIDLKTGRLAGCEALARFPRPSQRVTNDWFAEAHQVGLGVELQLLAVETALRQLPYLPPRIYLAVNAGPDIACDPRLLEKLDRVDASRVVVEVTEHEQIQDYDRLVAAAHAIRRRGALLAVDDTGAGFAGFSHILKLAPDLIKLDRVLTTGVDADPARQALAGALVNFAYATGAKVIAEGVETADELITIRELGIDYGQGYHLGRPGPASLLPHATGAHLRR